MVDLVESVPLVEQSHQPADERGLNVPQLDRAQVISRWLGRWNRRTRRSRRFRARASRTSPVAVRRSRRPAGVLPPGSCGSTAADLVDQQGRLREPPDGPLVAFDLANLVHEIGGGVLVAGCHGQVEQPEPDTEVLRLEGRQLAPVLARQVRIRRAGSPPWRADRGMRAGRRRRLAARVSASLSTAALAAVPPSRPQ